MADADVLVVGFGPAGAAAAIAAHDAGARALVLEKQAAGGGRLIDALVFGRIAGREAAAHTRTGEQATAEGVPQR